MESVRVETPSGERVYQGDATSGMGFRGEVHVRIASRLWGLESVDSKSCWASTPHLVFDWTRSIETPIPANMM